VPIEEDGRSTRRSPLRRNRGGGERALRSCTARSLPVMR
jgi:hypothetical protein